MTSTASPARTLLGQRSRGRLDDRRVRGPGSPGGGPRPRRPGAAAEAIVVSGSRPAQMSAIATASASASDVGERVEHGRGPMVGQRLVDGPDAPARLALANGRERLADRRRVVAVVVVDHDAAGLALALEPPPDAARTPASPAAIRAGAERRAPPRRRRRASALRGVVAAGRGEAHRERAGERVEPVDLEGRAVGVGRDDPAEQRRRPDRRPSRTARRSRAGSRRGRGDASTSAYATIATGPAREASTTSSRRPDRRRWRRASPPSGHPRAARPRTRRSTAAAVGEDVGVVPLGRRSGRRRPAGRHRSCRRTRRPRRRTPRPRPSARSPAGRRSATPAAAPRRTPTGRARPRRATWTSQPAVVLLPCVPATATSVRPTAASATTCCHGSSGIPAVARRDQLGLVGVDRGQRLGHRQPIGPRRRRHVGRRRARPRSRCPAPRAPACTATARPGRSRHDRARRAAASRAAALAPAPAAPTTWIRSPGRIGRAARAAASPAPTRSARRGHAGSRSPTRRGGVDPLEQQGSRAAAALSRLFSAPVAGQT